MKRINIYFVVEDKMDIHNDDNIYCNGRIDDIKSMLENKCEGEEVNVQYYIRNCDCYNDFVLERIEIIRKRLLPEYYSEIDYSSSSCTPPSWTKRMISLKILNNFIKD